MTSVKSNGKGYVLVAVDKVGCGIEFVDPVTKKSIKRLNMPARPHELVVTPDHKLAYVTIYGDGIYGNNVHRGHQLDVIDLQRMEKVDQVDLSPWQAPHGLAWDAYGKLWVTCDKSRHVIVINPNTKTVERAVPTDTDGCHWIIAVDGGRRMYTSNKDTPYVGVFDAEQQTLTKRIEVPNGVEGICSSPDGKIAYASDHRETRLLQFDTQTDTLKQTVELKGYSQIPVYEDHEMRVRATPDGKYVVISGYKWDVAVIVDAADLTKQKLLKTRKGPMGFGFPPFDPTLVYMADHDSGSISVIDLKTKDYAESFPCGTGVECMEFIPATA